MAENWRKLPRDGKSRTENLSTQPLLNHRVFNNAEALPEGWYPLARSRDLRKGQARSVTLLSHRVVLYRGSDRNVHALDAFCPHMGADLGNGQVVGNELQCYFHQWRFDGQGNLTDAPCGKVVGKSSKTASWPCEEKYGLIWVYSAPVAPYPVPVPAGMENRDYSALPLGTVTLFAHHHVMMAGAIDLQHFSTVHKLDIQFQFDVKEHSQPQVFDWELEGMLPAHGWRARLGRFLLGSKFGYVARFAGGSIVALTYGPNQRFRGNGFRLPALHLLWGCVPQENGVSRVTIVALAPRGNGIFGRVTALFRNLATVALLTVLRDDDVKAFPNMRFSTSGFVKEDQCVAQFVKKINSLPLSDWEKRPGSTPNP